MTFGILYMHDTEYKMQYVPSEKNAGSNGVHDRKYREKGILTLCFTERSQIKVKTRKVVTRRIGDQSKHQICFGRLVGITTNNATLLGFQPRPLIYRKSPAFSSIDELTDDVALWNE